jgi:cytochrome c-type biogenesis protein CcmH/NrfG
MGASMRIEQGPVMNVFSSKQHVMPLALVAALCLAPAPAHAAGGGGGSGGSSGGTTAAPTQDPDYRAGLAAWKSKDWPTVVAAMSRVIEREPANADAWNHRGHAYRQLGDMDKSFQDYERALKIDPGHRAAREYLGEAHLQVGNLAGAEEQLRWLDKLCWLPCEEFTDLKEQIAGYKRAHPPGK